MIVLYGILVVVAVFAYAVLLKMFLDTRRENQEFKKMLNTTIEEDFEKRFEEHIENIEQPTHHKRSGCAVVYGKKAKQKHPFSRF